MKSEMAYIKRYNVVGQILWVKDGLYKITFNHNGDIKTEIFMEKEFDLLINNIQS